MTLESNLTTAFQAVGADMKAVRASGPVAFDSAARRADAILMPGVTLDSGHRYTVRANEDAARFKFVSGALTHDRGGASGTQTTTAAAYAGTQIPGPVGRIWVDFQVADSTTRRSRPHRVRRVAPIHAAAGRVLRDRRVWIQSICRPS